MHSMCKYAVMLTACWWYISSAILGRSPLVVQMTETSNTTASVLHLPVILEVFLVVGVRMPSQHGACITSWCNQCPRPLKTACSWFKWLYNTKHIELTLNFHSSISEWIFHYSEPLESVAKSKSLETPQSGIFPSPSMPARHCMDRAPASVRYLSHRTLDPTS